MAATEGGTSLGASSKRPASLMVPNDLLSSVFQSRVLAMYCLPWFFKSDFEAFLSVS